jgi:hypothetical protein
MSTTVAPEVDFQKVRNHRGSQANGFEELVCQLFLRELLPDRADFNRVEGAGGDDGVEAYVVRKNQTEVGIQAKWFDKLGDSQWRQIDKSVRTAISQHPDLVRYEIAVPLIVNDSSEVAQNYVEAPAIQDVTGNGYPDPFRPIALRNGREAWSIGRPDELSPLITSPEAPDGEPADDWIALTGYWTWKEPKLLRLKTQADGTLKQFVHLRSWLVPDQNAQAYLGAIKRMDFWGTGVMIPLLGDQWTGEYPWGREFHDVARQCEAPDEWTEAITIPHVQTACDADHGGKYFVPSPQMCKLLDIQWRGFESEFCDGFDRLVACQVQANDNRFLLVRRSHLLKSLRRNGQRLVWGILGEKDCFNGVKHVFSKWVSFCGVYHFNEKKETVDGRLTNFKIHPIPPDD